MTEEFVDLVDSAGTVRVRGIARGDLRGRKHEFVAKGLYQPIVIVVVLDALGRVASHQRAIKSDDGDGQIDHVCGAIRSDEPWDVAADRESSEEIGYALEAVHLVDARVNEYQRYRYLGVARVDFSRGPSDGTDHVHWATPADLRKLAMDGTPFVDGFFSDLDLALASLPGHTPLVPN